MRNVGDFLGGTDHNRAKQKRQHWRLLSTANLSALRRAFPRQKHPV